MKYFTLLLAIVFSGALQAQLNNKVQMETTSKLPEGTFAKDGKIMVRTGYKARFSEKDNKVVVIQAVAATANRPGGAGVITGSFTCSCRNAGTDDCTMSLKGDNMICVGPSCSTCDISVVINPKAGLAITRETKGVTWKRFVIPAKTQ